MRPFVLACAALFAGCLHAQTPSRHAADPTALSEFARLVADPSRIEDAAVYAAAHHLSREEKLGPASVAYASFMRMEAYVFAAEIGWRFDFGQSAIDLPMAFQRKRAGMATSRYMGRHDRPDAGTLRYAAQSGLRDEALIGCVYSSRPRDGKAVVDDTLSYRQIVYDDSVLFPLLDDRCPVSPERRDMIIDQAFSNRMDDFAIRHAAATGDWLPEQRVRFVWGFFRASRCAPGFRAVAAMGLPSPEVIPMVETSTCESVGISTDGWSLGKDEAISYFFAAVRARKYHLALTLLEFTDSVEDGRIYVFQEAMRGGYGAELMKTFVYHAGLHDPFMQYAFDQGRYRFVGTNAQSYDWQRKAFDKLIELDQYDFAGEVAQYGFSETLRTQGVVLAFQAAMVAGDFKSGRYFVARYGPTETKPGLVTQEMYDEAQRKWYDAKAASAPPPPAPVPAKKKRKRPKPQPCPDGDWCVGDGK